MARDETDARLQGIAARLEQLSDSELDDAVADAERAWGPYSVKTHDLRDQIKAERDRRNGPDTNTQAEQDDAGEQPDGRSEKIPAAV